MSENLWDLNFNNISDSSTINVVDMIKKYATSLKNETNGKVKAKFGVIQDVSIATTVGKFALMQKKEIIEGEDTSSLKNGNSQFKDKRYGFEIYNDEYKFRVFEIKVLLEYPLKVVLDEGVAEYMNLSCNDISVESDEQLQNSLKDIFSSIKVKSILAKMIKN